MNVITTTETKIGSSVDAATWLGRRLAPTLVVGRIVECDGRYWRVGLVNFTRARLDPVTGKSACVAGHTFTSYGDSINVCPTALLPVVDEATLDAAAQRRLAKVASHEESVMAEQAEGGANVSGVPIPAHRVTKSEKLARKPKNGARPLGEAKSKRVAGAPRERKPKVEREMRPCACGCGEKTGGYFIAGHDARFKGWLLALERGRTQLHGYDLKEGQERTPLPKKVQEQYKWVRRGDGWRPTTNYKGESHAGYDKE